ncbi:MAG TPA: sigma-70 family RNA polymerase sigma factor [Saprospiraceae bacterium]|nr:sigma-70 family RNA polymerase sigma factor [Saprospiraceae bacterium]HRO72599.1 sigma-70 family RNA polymerase sigma factor [Saprospiraceae bacterium]HRP42017.1 sigma-70 family RNA polymerase sigma factor [Saprospiraceae bacterium]
MDISIKISIPDEGDFIRAVLNNERWAQKQLYEDHYPAMMAIALRYSNNEDDALDILHESFIKVFINLNKYKVNSSLSAWIRRILINTAIDYYWKEIRRKTDDIEQAFDLKSDIPDVISDISTVEILDSIQQLSPAYRSIFNMFVIEGYTHREIAEILHINESTCRANLVKARAKLKSILIAKDFNK